MSFIERQEQMQAVPVVDSFMVNYSLTNVFFIRRYLFIGKWIFERKWVNFQNIFDMKSCECKNV